MVAPGDTAMRAERHHTRVNRGGTPRHGSRERPSARDTQTKRAPIEATQILVRVHASAHAAAAQLHTQQRTGTLLTPAPSAPARASGENRRRAHPVIEVHCKQHPTAHSPPCGAWSTFVSFPTSRLRRLARSLLLPAQPLLPFSFSAPGTREKKGSLSVLVRSFKAYPQCGRAVYL